MSLPVSYEVKACHYHDSIILTLPAKLQGAAKGKRRGRGARGRERGGAVDGDMKSSEEYLSISGNIASFVPRVYHGIRIAWEWDGIN